MSERTPNFEDPVADLRLMADGGAVRLRAAAAEIESLRSQLRAIAAHWPGKWTRYCCACDDEPWPCQVVLDVVVPWMEPEEDEDA